MSEDEDWFERALRESEVDDSDQSADAQESPSPASDSPTDEEPSEEDGLFEEDFAAAFQGADVPGESGPAFPGDEGQEPDTFGDEAPGSDIPRIDLGIDGLDNMIEGGVPERSLMVTIGPPGSGKTTFGMQFLDAGLQQGQPGVFISLEENTDRVIRSATEKGMPYDEYAKTGQLAVVDLDAIDMANSLRSIQTELVDLIEDFGATRLVLDSVSLLEMMFEDRATRRNEIYSFTKLLKQAGVTTMLTSEVSDDNPYVSRHGIVEYLTDAVFFLQYIRPEDFQETRMAVEIQKIRDANHSREKKPYEISDAGLSVYEQATIF
ncbi:MAG: KaiC domain-containing protein [Salinarchaeum sp.]